MSWKRIQPSQLYLNRQKLRMVEQRYQNASDFDAEDFPPIPIKKRNGNLFFTDGHHRAFTAFKRGVEMLPVEWDEEDLDWGLYDVCVSWCDEKNIMTIADLDSYIIPAREYKQLWIGRCEALARELDHK